MTRDTALVLTNLTLATMVSGNVSYGLVEDGAIVLEGGQILYAGPKGLLPDDFKGWEHEDCGGAVATPALIDCHTHLVYGGNRAKEFELRLNGASYAEIAKAILLVSTSRATRSHAIRCGPSRWPTRHCRFAMGETRYNDPCAAPTMA